MVLELYQQTSSCRKSFQKAQSYGLGHIKIDVTNQHKRNDNNFPIKCSGYILAILPLITPIGTKQVQQKNSYLQNIATAIERKINNYKPNPLLIQTLVYTQVKYLLLQNLPKRILRKECTISSGTTKKYELPETQLRSPFGRVTQVSQTYILD